MFGWLRNRPIVRDDQIFGKVKFRRPDVWEGELELGGVPVEVAIPGDVEGPSGAYGPLFNSLPRRFELAKPAVGRALTARHEEHIATYGGAQLSVADSSVWEAFSLLSVELLSEEEAALWYCFSHSNDDSMFIVRLGPAGVAAEAIGD